MNGLFRRKPGDKKKPDGERRFSVDILKRVTSKNDMKKEVKKKEKKEESVDEDTEEVVDIVRASIVNENVDKRERDDDVCELILIVTEIVQCLNNYKKYIW